MKQLNDLGVGQLLDKEWGKVISSIEEAFLDGTGKMVPKIYLEAGNAGDYRAMPAALGGYAAIKWIGVFPNNPKGENPMKRKLPTTIGTLILNDRFTGLPLMAMDCTTLTAYRTAATSALAAKYCLPNNIREIAFVGCGLQAYYHFLAYRNVFPNIKTVSLYDKNEEAIQKLASKIPKSLNIIKYPSNVEEAVKQADLVTTLTPSTEPYLDFNYLKDNCHVNAVGADAVGKRELKKNIITRASNIVCDDPAQAFHSGELQYIFGQDLNTWSLRHVIKHSKEINLEAGVSVFDSTGGSLEDIAVGILVYNLYSENELK